MSFVRGGSGASAGNSYPADEGFTFVPSIAGAAAKYQISLSMTCGRRSRASARMGAAAGAAKPSPGGAPAVEGGSVTIRGIWHKPRAAFAASAGRCRPQVLPLAARYEPRRLDSGAAMAEHPGRIRSLRDPAAP